MTSKRSEYCRGTPRSGLLAPFFESSPDNEEKRGGALAASVSRALLVVLHHSLIGILFLWFYMSGIADDWHPLVFLAALLDDEIIAVFGVGNRPQDQVTICSFGPLNEPLLLEKAAI
jgi:hypothetical protein